MNAQEKLALQDFLQELTQARLQSKDPEADAMIAQGLQRQPDAAYLLVQRALLQEQAIQALQQQVAQLREQLQSQAASGARPSSSFLDPSSQWGMSGRALSQPSMPAAAPAAPERPAWQEAAPPMAAVPAPRPGLMGGGSGSFLGSMAGMLAGAAAGSFLYQGIEQLMHRHDPGHGLANMGDNQSGLGNQAGLGAGNPLADAAGVNDVGRPSRDEPAQWDESSSDDQLADNGSDSGFDDDGLSSDFGNDDLA